VFHKVLGRLPDRVIDHFRDLILSKKQNVVGFQRIEFDDKLTNYFLSIFINQELIIQTSADGKRKIQKAFYSDSGVNYPIHKDGSECRSALNIAIDCNDSDWVRWYDNDLITSMVGEPKVQAGPRGTSRNTSLIDNDNIEFLEQYIPNRGEVYIVDVNTFHTWRAYGTSPRIIIQTKFKGFPDFNTLVESLSKSSFIDV
jgi:hypothetical protein